MKLVKPEAYLVDKLYGQRIMEKLEAAGRICYKSEAKGDPDGFIRKILARGHESVIEHETVSAKIVCDRGVSHEIVRHRVASYSQESTRYCDYGDTGATKHVTFILPPWCPDIPLGEYDGMATTTLYSQLRRLPGIEPQMIWLFSMKASETAYQNLRSQGWQPQQARGVLPNDLKTELYMTANLREWRHIFRLRTAPGAHPQCRHIFQILLQEFQASIPALFSDFNETEISR